MPRLRSFCHNSRREDLFPCRNLGKLGAGKAHFEDFSWLSIPFAGDLIEIGGIFPPPGRTAAAERTHLDPPPAHLSGSRFRPAPERPPFLSKQGYRLSSALPDTVV